MTSDQAILRTTIVPGLVEAARTGVDAGDDDVALFEIARVYLPSGEQLPDERWRVGRRRPGRLRGRRRACSRRCTTRSASSCASQRGSHTLLHPGKAAETDAGWLGELHPTLLDGTWGVFELDLETLFDAVPERVVYEDVITYPATLQDIAVAVDEDVEVGALVGRRTRGGAASSCARRASSTSIAATRWARGASRSRSTSPSSRRSARSPRRRRRSARAGSSPRSPSASAPSCAPSQSDRPRRSRRQGREPDRRPRLRQLVVALSRRRRRRGAPAQSVPSSSATSGPGFTIKLRDAPGARVSKLDPGPYDDRGRRQVGRAQLPSLRARAYEPLDRDRRHRAR